MFKYLFLLFGMAFSISSYSQLNNTSLEKRTGWLFYNGDKVIWFESGSNKRNLKDKAFFTSNTDYLNGLVVNYIPIAKYYKSIANCYSIKVLTSYDTALKKADYVLADNICILPVEVKFKANTEPVSELLKPMGLSFQKSQSEVTIKYNFETNYSISEIELLRNKDKKRLKKINKKVRVESGKK